MAEIIRRMTELGAPPEAVAFAVDAIETMSTMSRGLSTGQEGTRRERERNKKRKYRAKLKTLRERAEANDAALSTKMSTDVPGDKGDDRCDLSFSPRKEGFQEGKKEKKKEREDTRERGTRLSADAPLTESDRQFARDLGLPDAAIDTAWAEFIDYWTAIPGQRGLKTKWDATWRNRVRAIVGRIKGKPNGTSGIIAAADRLVERVREFDQRPGIRGGAGTADVRLLPDRRRERS